MSRTGRGLRLAPPHRARAPSVLLGILLAAGACGKGASAQEGAFAGWNEIVEEGFVHDPDATEVATFALPVSAEVRHRFRDAEELMRLGGFRRAAELLQEVINLFPNHVIQVGERPPRWVGAGEYARWLLGTFPPEGREEYAAWASLRVEPRFDEARAKGDEALLEMLAHQWVLTPPGWQALRMLGDRAWERGDQALAERCYRRLMLFAVPPAEDSAGIALRTAAALALQGEGARGLELLAPFAGRKSTVAGEARDVLEAFRGLEPDAGRRRREWPMFGGAADHAGLVPADATVPRAGRSWWTPAFLEPSSNPYASPAPPGYEECPFHAAVSGDTIVATDGLEVRAFTPFTKEPRWVFAGPLASAREDGEFYLLTDYVQDRGTYGPLGSLARKLALMPTIANRIVLAPLLEVRPRAQRILYDSTEITPPIPERSLHAIDLDSGRLLWRQRRPELPEHAFINRLSINAPPIVVGERVIAAGYVLEGAINYHVVCLSLKDGSLLWRTPLVVGQQELTMFNKTFKEPTTQPPAERDGSVVVCTNLGLVACLDTLSGDIRWVTRYDSIPIRGAQHYTLVRERATISNNDAPLIADGVALFTPHDARTFHALDLATGKPLWSRSFDAEETSSFRYRFLLGAENGVAVLAGETGIGFHDIQSGARLGGRAYGRNLYPGGRGCLGPGVVYQPLNDRLLVLCWSARPFQISEPASEVAWPRDQTGNLVVCPDFQVTIGQEALSVFFDAERLAAETRRRVVEGSPSLEDLILLGELEYLLGDCGAAVAVLDQALARPDIDEDGGRRVRDGLFRAHRRLADEMAAAGDLAATLRHRTEEARHAADARAFLATAELLLALYDQAHDLDGYLATLDWIDERCADAEYAFAVQKRPAPLRAGVFTLEQRAAVALARGRPEDAVAAWQEMILRYRNEPFQKTSAGSHAQERIAEAIAAHGREVYAAFEERARDMHAAALAAHDCSALAALIELYPNSESALCQRLDLACLHLEAGDAAGVFRVAAPLLGQELELPQRAQALHVVALAAESAGDGTLAAALLERLRQCGGEVAVLGGEGESYATVAARALERLRPPGARTAAAARLLGTLALEPRELALRPDRYTKLVPIAGGALPVHADAVLLFEPGAGAESDGAWLRLIDVAELREVWRAPVDDYYGANDPAATVVGGSLIVRQRSTLRGFDPASGVLLFERDLPTLPTRPLLEDPGPGLYFTRWDRPEGGFSLAAIEPSSGGFFWRREFPGRTADLLGGGGLVLVVRSDAVLEALDALTGATRYVLSLLEISRSTRAVVFERFDLLLVVGYASGESRPCLKAFDLQDGRELWSLTKLPPKFGVRWVHAAKDALLLLEGSSSTDSKNATGVHTIRVLEPRSGALRREIAGLARLTAFEEGPLVFGGHLVMLEPGPGARGRAATQRLFVIDLESGERQPVVLAGLPQERAEFAVFETAAGGLAGKIDVKPTVVAASNRTYVFALDPGAGTARLARVPAQRDAYVSSALATPRALVLLKDDCLFVFPAEEGSR
ncbi:MAG: PQQ-binding-like beta-propeller repeat protein [Planctomycetes bacterium]|nr:PQQ-binding-like beta-propeller repeat protein [Planctomycetota bacterium]